nr:MAG TPA: hypothetical protein [Bacteriophage sp.]
MAEFSHFFQRVLYIVSPSLSSIAISCCNLILILIGRCTVSIQCKLNRVCL